VEVWEEFSLGMNLATSLEQAECFDERPIRGRNALEPAQADVQLDVLESVFVYRVPKLAW
jgi:hypothetical protein